MVWYYVEEGRKGWQETRPDQPASHASHPQTIFPPCQHHLHHCLPPIVNIIVIICHVHLQYMVLKLSLVDTVICIWDTNLSQQNWVVDIKVWKSGGPPHLFYGNHSHDKSIFLTFYPTPESPWPLVDVWSFLPILCVSVHVRCLSSWRMRRTKSRGPKGFQLEVRGLFEVALDF